MDGKLEGDKRDWFLRLGRFGMRDARFVLRSAELRFGASGIS